MANKWLVGTDFSIFTLVLRFFEISKKNQSKFQIGRKNWIMAFEDQKRFKWFENFKLKFLKSDNICIIKYDITSVYYSGTYKSQDILYSVFDFQNHFSVFAPNLKFWLIFFLKFWKIARPRSKSNSLFRQLVIHFWPCSSLFVFLHVNKWTFCW